MAAHQQYTYKAYNAAGCNAGDLLASITFEPSGDVLTATSVTATTAVLELSNHTGAWWFKQTAPTEGTCTAGDSSFSHALSDLIPGTEYTYKSYDVNTCGDTHVGASADFTTGGVSVSNLSLQGNTGCLLGSTNEEKCAAGFTTGGAANGYTRHSITGRFGNVQGNPTNFAVALHTSSGGRPASTAISNATLNGSAPTSAGDHTYTCSGAGCDLLQNTTYHVVFSASGSGGNVYIWRYASSFSDVKTPSNNGWSITDTVHNGSTFASEQPFAGMIKAAATVK